MIDEITDPNCIVKAFEKSSITIIKDKNNKFYFRGTDVAKALGIANIRSSIQNFTDKEKGVRKVDTLGGPQDIIFLSSHGIYRLLYSSKKKIAEEFREWVGDILDDLIFNQGNELKLQLDKFHLELEEKNKLLQLKDEQINIGSVQLIQNCQQILLDSYNKKCIVYLIKITNTLFKFGNTDDIVKRFSDHRREINENIQLIFCIESKNNTLLEQKLKDFLKTTDYRKTLKIKKKNQTELIEINNITIIENQLKKLNKDVDDNLEILKVQENILALQLRLAEIENKELITETGNLEEDLLKMNETIQKIREKKRKVYLKVRRQNPEVKERERLLERERYKILSQTEEYKAKHKVYKHKYYEKNKEELKIKSSTRRKQKSKTVIANNPEEKEKFMNWCKQHIILNENKEEILQWTETFKNYLVTNDRIGGIYKKYMEEFIKNTFPNMNHKYTQFCVKQKSIYGWKNIKYI
jgi:prophage antirepressor-like protein